MSPSSPQRSPFSHPYMLTPLCSPRCSKVALFAPDGSTLVAELRQLADHELPGASSSRPSTAEAAASPRSGAQLRFRADNVKLPRLSLLRLQGFMHDGELNSCGWTPLLTLPVLPQVSWILLRD